MDLVTEGREFDAKLGGDDARSTVSGITRDPDAHEPFFGKILTAWSWTRGGG